MRYFLAFALLIPTCSVALAQVPTTQPTVAVNKTLGNGRFQLVQGEVDGYITQENGQTGSDRSKMLFKIDTLTGETWYFYWGSAGGKVTEGWAPLHELAPKE